MPPRYRQWLNEELVVNNRKRDKAYPQSLAVGSESFVDKLQALPGTRATNWKVAQMGGKHVLREQSARYNIISGAESTGLKLDNRLF